MAQGNGSTRRRGQIAERDMRYIVQLGKQGSADVRWMAKIPDGRNENGKPLYKRIKRSDLDVVISLRDAYLKGQREQKPRQLGRPEKGMTVGQWVTHWLEHVVRVDKSASTYDMYLPRIERHVIHNSLGQRPLAQLTQGRVEEWRGELEQAGVSRSVINYVLARLKTALEVAVEPGRQAETGITLNVARKVKPLKVADTVPYVGDPAETVRLVAALGDTYLASLIQVATDLGLRRSEIAGLQWGDLDLDAGLVTIKRHLVVSGNGDTRTRRFLAGTKTSKGAWKTLPLSSRSVAMLRQAQTQLREHKMACPTWRAGTVTSFFYAATSTSRTGTPYIVPQNPIAPDALVWPYRRTANSHNVDNVDGAPWDPTTLGNWFVHLARRVGIVGKTIHDLRHDCATFLIGAGVPLTVVADHMRHKDAALTAKVYAHLLASQERLAVRTQDQLWDTLYATSAAEAA